MSAYTDRGGAKAQAKDWKPLILLRVTFFVHCGSAPFAQGTTGLLLKFSKEVCTVQGVKDTKWILGFPLLDIVTPQTVPNQLTLSKPCQMLWDLNEMPRGFVFQLPIGTKVYTDKATLTTNQEVGFNFDILFDDFLVAQYKRKTKQLMELEPLNGAMFLR